MLTTEEQIEALQAALEAIGNCADCTEVSIAYAAIEKLLDRTIENDNADRRLADDAAHTAMCADRAFLMPVQ